MEKVLHIVRANAISGAEKHILMLLPRLAKMGFDVTLLTLADKSRANISEGYRQSLQVLKDNRVNVIQESVGNKYDLFSTRKLHKIITHLNPDIVHTHMPYADLFGGIAAKMAGVPIRITSRHHDYSTSLQDKRKFKNYYKFSNKFHNAVIPISDRVASLCREVEKWPASDIHLVLYGCEDEKTDKVIARNSLIKEMELPANSFLLGTVARLIAWKGHRYAVEAIALLKQYTNIFWLIVGDGPEKDNLNKLINDQGLTERVKFLGHRLDIPEIMAGIDVLVHPTLGEGFGLVLLEAMIQSTPIISTRTGAIPEVVKDKETGILVNPADSRVLAGAIKELYDQQGVLQKYGEQGRRRYEERFTVDVMAKNIAEVYFKLSKN